MANKQTDTFGFDFQAIDIAEARALSLAGSGRFAGIRAHLLEALPKLPVGQAYVFGNKNGKLVDKDKNGIITAINKTFKDANMPWKITYSGFRNVFVCARTESQSQRPIIVNRKIDYRDEILATADTMSGMTALSRQDIFKSQSYNARHARIALVHYLVKARSIPVTQIKAVFDVSSLTYALHSSTPDDDLISKLKKKMEEKK